MFIETVNDTFPLSKVKMLLSIFAIFIFFVFTFFWVRVRVTSTEH